MKYSIKPGDVIGNYHFEHPIGHGAYGVVWQGLHQYLEQPVAIKVIDTYALDKRDIERVMQECRIGGKLSNKAQVVEVRDAFPKDDQFFIVMELMSGGSLDDYLRQHPHPDFDLTLSWILDLCNALAEVHALDIVHRDIKPQNILLTDDIQVKLSDFGVAHFPGVNLTTVYQPGTHLYQAPEQETNQTVDAKTDVYALCAVFFEVWTRQQYFRYRDTDRSIVREEMSLFFADHYSHLSPELRNQMIDIILAGLLPHPERIFLANLQAALLAIQEGIITASSLKQPGRKYKPLQNWLIQQREDKATIGVTFQEIESLLGQPLPNSAREHRAWWANDATPGRHSLAWLQAGWRIDAVDQSGGEVTFRRTNKVLMQLFFADLLARLKATRPGLTEATKTQSKNWWHRLSFYLVIW